MVDGYVGEDAAIRTWFQAEWEAGVPIHLIEGSAFREKPTNAPWARLLIRPRASAVVSVGAPIIRHRHVGSVIVEIFTPDGNGDGRAKELGDLACDILRGRQENGVVVWNARAIPLGVQDGWVRVNVIAPYQRDQDFTVQN